MVLTVSDPAGIRKRTCLHLLRHSYATWPLNRGSNPIMLAQVLGHRSALRNDPSSPDVPDRVACRERIFWVQQVLRKSR